MSTGYFDEAYVPELLTDEELEYYRAGSYGGRVGWGTSPAVILVDVTRQFLEGDYELGRGDGADEFLTSVRQLLDTAREVGLPVSYTRGPSDQAMAAAAMKMRKGGTAYDSERGNELHPAITPQSGELVIEKPKASAFFDTYLANALRQDGVDTVIVGGVSTSGCVRATVIDACSHNFRVIIPQECVRDRSPTAHEMSLFDMDMKYGDVTTLETVLDSIRAVR